MDISAEDEHGRIIDPLDSGSPGGMTMSCPRCGFDVPLHRPRERSLVSLVVLIRNADLDAAQILALRDDLSSADADDLPRLAQAHPEAANILRQAAKSFGPWVALLTAIFSLIAAYLEVQANGSPNASHEVVIDRTSCIPSAEIERIIRAAQANPRQEDPSTTQRTDPATGGVEAGEGTDAP
jgi:hypothetical protein